MTALDPQDVWAVGGTFSGTSWRTFIAHWDGLEWQQVSSPAGQAPLRALVAFSAGDIWAAGSSVGDGDH